MFSSFGAWSPRLDYVASLGNPSRKLERTWPSTSCISETSVFELVKMYEDVKMQNHNSCEINFASWKINLKINALT